MNISEDFTRRVADDRLCAAVRQAVEEGNTAALERLGMRVFGRYAGRLAELIEESVRLGVDPDNLGFETLINELASPARYAHHLVNESGIAIQTALDSRNGLRIKPAEPEFESGRFGAIVSEAAHSESENAADNLAVQIGTMTKDAGNRFMEANAEQRDRAGFKVTVRRTGGADCCPWCSARTGSWELKNAPDGVFGCHDNCKCMVDYTNSKGAVSRRVGRSRFVDVPYEPPHVMTHEEAKEKGGFDEPKRLTGAANGGIINYARAIDSFFYADDYEHQTYTKEEIIEHLKTSPVGLTTIRYLEENPRVKVKLSENREATNRGQHEKNLLTIWLNNCPNVRVAAQTVVHEVTHHKYDIGGSQLAETICFAFEKMHKEGRDYVTQEEWDTLADLAKKAYWDYPPEGGVGDIERFNKIIK